MIFSSLEESRLELLRDAILVVYVAATVGVILGVGWEDEAFSKKWRHIGWLLLLFSLGLETLLTIGLFAADSEIIGRQRKEIEKTTKELASYRLHPICGIYGIRPRALDFGIGYFFQSQRQPTVFDPRAEGPNCRGNQAHSDHYLAQNGGRASFHHERDRDHLDGRCCRHSDRDDVGADSRRRFLVLAAATCSWSDAHGSVPM